MARDMSASMVIGCILDYLGSILSRLKDYLRYYTINPPIIRVPKAVSSLTKWPEREAND
jgi:hypothetical protein